MAAQAKMNLVAKGSQTQSTVDMDHMKGKRDSFLYNRLKSDYEDESFHVLQNDVSRSSLKQSPTLKFAKQTDRDKTSFMKEVWVIMNKRK